MKGINQFIPESGNFWVDEWHSVNNKLPFLWMDVLQPDKFCPFPFQVKVLQQLLRTGRESTCLRQVSVALAEAAISALREASIKLKAEISNSQRAENSCPSAGISLRGLFIYPLKFINKEINLVCWIHLTAHKMQVLILCFPGDQVPVLLLFSHDKW